MSEPFDPPDDFLRHPPALPADVALRQALAERTGAMLPRARRRRWPMAVAIAASIAVTLASGYFVLRQVNMDEPAQKDIVERQPEPLPKEEKPAPPAAAKPMQPRELEWSAFDAAEDADRVRLYFQAGDLYLDKHADYESAVRCYAQAIQYSEPRDLEFNPDDNWLVMALKRDHRKEN